MGAFRSHRVENVDNVGIHHVKEEKCDSTFTCIRLQVTLLGGQIPSCLHHLRKKGVVLCDGCIKVSHGVENGDKCKVVYAMTANAKLTVPRRRKGVILYVKFRSH
ncbi:hypothetical protein DKX38_015178 [Salix brachista]|uniref:Uncharacterized protein n=1 Tax=Salix brachista TaxID=2182728 RepID=A0A5N5L4H3_9ROSI|nr:hypothetical protein DKX38_015178 [Salix brachista]